MRKIILGALITVVAVVLTIGVVLAAKPSFIPAQNPAGKTVVIPAHAVEIAPGIFSLGQARDVDGRIVEGFLFIDNRKGNAKPPWAGKGKGGGEKCYAVFAKGAKWKNTESYVTGTGVDLTLTETSLNTWDTKVLFDVFGTRDI